MSDNDLMTFARTTRLPQSYEEKIRLLSGKDNLKPGPWMSKQIMDAVDARKKEVRSIQRQNLRPVR